MVWQAQGGTVMKLRILLVVILSLVFSVSVWAQTLFYDDFEDGADPAWGNEFGDWVAIDGVYTATIQTNDPPTYSSVTSLPELTDFVVEVDIIGVRDGGIFLRSHRCENGLVDGVILVVGGWLGGYNGCYWHISDCNGYSAPLNQVDITGLQGSDVHIRIEVVGDIYRAYLDEETEPITTLETDACPSGRVALYEFFDQSFDNVAISTFPTGVADNELPQNNQIDSIHPNPFNPQTTINFSLAREGKVAISVYDLTGRLVRAIGDPTYTAGDHSVVWNGKDLAGRTVPSGSYVVRMVTETGMVARKVMLIR
jgi:hypothetical protein